MPSTSRDVLVEPLRARERSVLADLGAIVDGRSLCSRSRQGAAVPWRSITREQRPHLPRLTGPWMRLWTAQTARTQHMQRSLTFALAGASSPAPSGERAKAVPGYLAGGLDALEQMIGDGGLDAFDAQD